MQRRLSRRLAMLALSASLPSVAAGIVVELDLRDPTLPLRGEIVVTAETLPEGRLLLPLKASVEVPSPGAGATLTCRGEGLWCPEVRLAAAGTRLPLFPAMTVTGGVAGPGVGATLATGTVQGMVAGEGAGKPIELRQTLSLDDHRFAFTAPRTTLDLRFAFPGAAPVYRWGVAPPAPEEARDSLHLGTLTLHPGGSLSGWVRDREAELPIPGASVVASPLTAQRERVPLHLSKAAADERGFFQLYGLAAGSYRLEVAAEGRVPQVLDAVEIAAGSETLIGTVDLDSPLQLSVQIDPPRHPSGEPWDLVLSPVRRISDEGPVRVTASREGIAEVGSLRPAEYYVKVQTANGEGLLFEQHEIRRDGWLTLEVPVVAVEGDVRLAGEPLEATVELLTGAGDRVELASDEDGAIAGWMRRPERPWVQATVSWREGDEERRRVLEVVPAIEDDVIRLEIELPSGAVYGEVVDSEGIPQRRFRVTATPAEDASSFTRIRGETDDSGRFHLTGLSPTRYFLQAGGNGGTTSEVVPVDLSPGYPIDEVRLVVRPTRKLTIVVTAAGQPVAGATVSLAALGRIPVSLTSTSDAQGRVELEVPEDVERAVVRVVAPSRLLWSACLPIAEERLPLALPDLPMGVLSLTLSGRNDLPPILGGRMVLLTGDGGFVEYGALVHWNRKRNDERVVAQEDEHVVETITLSGLAPGSYALTWTRAPEWELAARACAGAFGELEWVTLPPGGEAALSSDSSERQAQRLRELVERAQR